MEGLNVFQLFADAGEFNRLPGHSPDGKRRAAPGITVQLGQHHRINIQPFIKGLGCIHCILTSHGIHNQHDFVGLDSSLDVFQFFHQLLIHMEAASSIQKHHVIATLASIKNSLFCRLHRVLRPALKNRDSKLFTAHL